ncbi:hypothetical protein [Burkholderia sp. Bp9031]|uniref:hypothetical protein n=1 Tax=Burkholderia sp. Bp9031 TaxID=2184566 RepID=UPI000F5ED0D8|nr:hypothetical protein [Burkholderia sp. Bp9031]
MAWNATCNNPKTFRSYHHVEENDRFRERSVPLGGNQSVSNGHRVAFVRIACQCTRRGQPASDIDPSSPPRYRGADNNDGERGV